MPVIASVADAVRPIAVATAVLADPNHPSAPARPRCESCGRFVRRGHLRTARFSFAIDPALPVAVFSLATATRFGARLDCALCSMTCCRMHEATKAHGRAVGRGLPNHWEQCASTLTQADHPMNRTPR